MIDKQYFELEYMINNNIFNDDEEETEEINKQESEMSEFKKQLNGLREYFINENKYDERLKKLQEELNINLYHLKDGFSKYCVDENGNIYSLIFDKVINIKSYNAISKITLIKKANKTSYKLVKIINDDKKTKQVLVHHLVAYAKEKELNKTLNYKEFKKFLKNNSLNVDHINSKKDDNSFKNLQILTQTENLRKYHNEKQLLMIENEKLKGRLNEKKYINPISYVGL